MLTPQNSPLDYKDRLSSSVLADVLDALGHASSCLPPCVRPLRPDWKIFGRAATLSMAAVASVPAKPYALEMEAIDALKPGEVLVVTTNGEHNSALWGELLSTACKARGAVGAVIDGLTRDTTRILAMDFPVFATGFSPLDSKGRIDGISRGTPIRIGQCIVTPGDWIFADVDGVCVIPHQLADQAFAKAIEKVTGENKVREELAKGRSLKEVFGEYGIL